jgi:chemotaxis protein methyltransferase CheR
MTTNETFFFRDENPFEHIRRIMTEAARAGRPRLRIWSAACSTGQEPYSLLMLWDEVAHLAPNLRLEIVATDLSAACLTKARSGLYTGFEVQRGLSAQKLVTYFDKVDDNWRVKPHLRGAVAWSQHNLLESPHALGKFDIVLCRNVLIYFERETRSRVLELIARQLLPGGHLLLGASETILGLTTAVRNAPAGPGLYVKPDLEPESSTSSLAG